MNRRTILATLIALVCFGSVYALASSLGGVTSSKVGADNVAVASCDTDGVSSAYTTAWDTTDKRYEVTVATISGVSDTCDGQTLNVSLTDSTGVQIGTGSAAIPTSVATSFAVTLTTAPSAKLTENIHVLIAS